ncbi:hypothetical protein GBA52_009473 [Prunus armeniaca]|nr:hypothetical protein GBA52_009473 [Prunus armeniaca]
MCLIDAEQLGQEMGNMENNNINTNNNNKQWPLQCEILHNQTENLDKETPFDELQSAENHVKLISIFHISQFCGKANDADVSMQYFDDVNGNFKKKKKNRMFDGHGGKDTAQFVRDNLPRVVVEDADFPLELEKVITRSLLVANAGDCRAVLLRCGAAVEMSKDHRPCCTKERMRIESLGGYIDDGYLNGQLGVTRALGDWHLEGMKDVSERRGPLSALNQNFN